MNPSARVQAAIEVFDLILNAARQQGAAADVILARWFAERRYAGSKDRRAIRELVYDAIRLCGEPPVTGRAAMLALARLRPELIERFDGSSYGPTPIDPSEPVAEVSHLPHWLAKAFVASALGEAEQAALLGRAPLDLRINRLKGDVVIDGAEALSFAPDALRLPSDTPVEKLPEYADGRIEVQDAGSQLVTHAAQAVPGMAVVDLCAGGGGKTLALAAAMRNQGELLASDVDRARLSRLMPRAERAGVTIAETRLLNPDRELEALEDWRDRADIVLVDAPCSGTGTWRRNPEARWRLTPDRLQRYVGMQRQVLGIGAQLVRPGGVLTFITCSLLDAEGAEQVDWFLRTYPDWAAQPLALAAGTPHGQGMRLTPAHDTTDGFFVARLVRPC